MLSVCRVQVLANVWIGRHENTACVSERVDTHHNRRQHEPHNTDERWRAVQGIRRYVQVRSSPAEYILLLCYALERIV